MRIQARLFIIVMLFTVIFGTVLLPAIFLKNSTMHRLAESGLQQEEEVFDNIVELIGRPLENYAFDYTYWDEMVDFFRTGDKTWGKENIDATLSTYEADLALLYRLDYTFFYAAYQPEQKETVEAIGFSPEMLSRLFSGKKFCHFFVDTPYGPVEFRGAAIFITSDIERKGECYGYFLVGRLWSEERLSELSSVTGTKINISLPSEARRSLSKKEIERGQTLFSRTLSDWRGEPLLRLDIIVTFPSIAILNQLNRVIMIVFIFCVALASSVGFFFLRRWVSLPLEEISATLNSEDTSHLAYPRKQKNEFSEFAELISKFFIQREVLLQEIESRKKAEEELLSSEQRLQSIFNNINIGIAVIGSDMEVISLNNKMQQWFPNAVTTGKSICYRVFNTPPREGICSYCPTYKTLQDGLVHEAITETPVRGGGIVNYRVVSTPFKKEGKVVAAIELVEDVTQSSQWEHRLIKINECFLGFGTDSQRNLKSLVALCADILRAGTVFYGSLEDGSPVIKAGWNLPPGFALPRDPEGHICFDVLREAKDDCIVFPDLGSTAYAQTDPNVVQYGWKSYLGYAVKVQGSCIGVLCVVYGREYRPSEEDKRILGVIASAVGIEEERSSIRKGLQQALDESERQKQAMLNILEDMQQAREELMRANEALTKTQAQLIQASKMSAVGQLASGVAHEINNPLTGVLNNVQLIKMEAESKKDFSLADFRQLLDIIEESALRCTKITASLLNFSRASKGMFSRVGLNKLVDDVGNLIAHELRLQNIRIEKILREDLPAVSGDPQLLQQVIFDIITNGRWAIQKKSGRDGGVITIKTEYDSSTKTVIMQIADTGIGIPEENLDKIFDPFFTTKPVGEGTGLGLAIVYSIIKEHGGIIEAASEVGRGATFTIRLPAAV